MDDRPESAVAPDPQALHDYFNNELGGVLAGIKSKAKRPYTTRPTGPGDVSIPWSVHKSSGWLDRGVELFLKGKVNGYLVPGSVPAPGHDDVFLVVADIDREHATASVIEGLRELPLVLVYPKPSNPSRAHVWLATRRCVGNGRLYAEVDGTHVHVGDVRGRGDTCGVGVALYPGEGEALVAALKAGSFGVVEPAALDLYLAKPREMREPKRPRNLAQVLKHIASRTAGERYYAMRDCVAMLVGFRRWNEDDQDAVRRAYADVCVGDYSSEQCATLVDNAARGALAKYEAGVWQWPPVNIPKSRQRNHDEVVEELGGVDTLAGALREHEWEIRYNLRGMLDEVRRLPDGEWMPLTDRLEAHLRTLLDGVQWQDRVWRILLNNTLYHHEVDPVREWLDGLPVWDGTPRVDDWCANAFNVRSGYEPLAQWASRHVFLGAVTRTLAPGTKLDVTPVIEADQGMGKSWHMSLLLPPHLRHAFGDELNLSGKPQQMLEALQGKMIVEIAEMHGFSGARLDTLKAFLTRTVDSAVRLAYRRNPEVAARRCVFIGTVNNDGTGILPNDPTGNRRWAVVPLCGRGTPADVLMRNRDQYWAEAVHRVQAGESPAFPADLADHQRDVNEEFREHDPLEELVDQCAYRVRELMAGATRCPGVTLHVLMEYAQMLPPPDSSQEPRANPGQVPKREAFRLARALRARGWTRQQVQVDGTRAWYWQPPRAATSYDPSFDPDLSPPDDSLDAPSPPPGDDGFFEAPEEAPSESLPNDMPADPADPGAPTEEDRLLEATGFYLTA